MRPGIVYASLRAYGWDGPWANRRGVRVSLQVHLTRSHSQDFFQFDSLTQTSTGLNVAEAEAFNSMNSPEDHVPLKALPVQALDHAAGQLLALGINAALARTYTVSLRSIPSLRYRLLAVDCTILILPNRITLLFIHTTAHLVLEFLGRWLL